MRAWIGEINLAVRGLAGDRAQGGVSAIDRFGPLARRLGKRSQFSFVTPVAVQPDPVAPRGVIRRTNPNAPQCPRMPHLTETKKQTQFRYNPWPGHDFGRQRLRRMPIADITSHS